MSDSCVVKLLGIGALSIQFDGITYYIDSFNDYNEPPKLNQNDVVLFTHDDKDHFLPNKLSSKLNQSNVIIGPPSIGLPLLVETSATQEQIKLPYPVDGDSPITLKIGSATIKVFRTEHFLDWHAIHISFLIEVGSLKLYITGDSN